MTDTRDLREALIKRILDGPGAASASQRRAAFEDTGLTEHERAWARKVATEAVKITDRDVAAARTSGLTDNQIFESAVCAAVGQAARQYETAAAALASALRKE